MADETSAFRKQLNIIRARFKSEAEVKLAALRDDWRELPPGSLAEVRVQLEALFRQAHNFTGSGSSFGMQEFAAQARSLECYTQAILDSEAPLNKAQLKRIQEQLQRVQQELGGSSNEITLERDTPSTANLRDEADNRLVFLVEDDANQASELALQLGFLNYVVETFSEPEHAFDQLSQREPAVILMDIVFPEGPLAGPVWLTEMKGRMPPVPIIFISVRTDFESRLAALRAGGTHYFAKPIDIRKLADTLEEVTRGSVRGPYRILVVDDEPQEAALHSLILEQAGMITSIVSQPADVLAVLDRFQPDLVLTDLYMPDCHGSELAGIMRQHHAFATLPIIFLSSEDRFDKQLDAMRLGGEDFVSKPVAPRELVALVSRRAHRARQMHGLSSELSSLLREYETQKYAINQHVLLFFTDPEGNVTFANNRMLEVTGQSLVDFLGTPLKAAHRRKHYPESLWKTLEQGKVWNGKLRHTRENGQAYWLELTVVPTFDRDERVSSLIWVAHDISEHQKQKQELREDKSRLELLLKAKRDLLAFTSHEMRGSLGGLAGMARLLVNTNLNREQREFVESMNSASDHLLAIINQTLDFSKIEAGKLELEEIFFDLRQCVESVGELFAANAHEKSLQLILDMEPQVPEKVKGDPLRLRQILINLVNNALKFTESGFVRLRLRLIRAVQDRAQILFEVEDSGIGIPKDRQNLLFQMFSQTDASTSRVFGGSGLGLAISSRLVDAMNGQLEVRSALGSGSLFSFELELAFEAQEAGSVLAGQNVLVVCNLPVLADSIVNLLVGFGVTSVVAAASSAFEVFSNSAVHLNSILYHLEDRVAAANFAERVLAVYPDCELVLLASTNLVERAKSLFVSGFHSFLLLPLRKQVLFDELKSPDALAPYGKDQAAASNDDLEQARSQFKVLVAEDNPINRRILTTVLKNGGYQVFSVHNGRECLEYLAAHPVDLVLMDCHMPVLDGMEALTILRSRERGGRHMPVLAITGEDPTDPVSRERLSNFDHYLLKPVNPVALFAFLDEALMGASSPMGEIHHETGHPLPLDLSRFQALTQGDSGLERSLVEMFQLSVHRELVNLEAALRHEDLSAVLQLAHSIKGACLELGAHDLAQIAGRLEYYGTHGQLDAALSLFASLTSEFQRVKVFLADYLAKQSGMIP